MNRKRFVCLALVGVLAFAGLAGCGKEEESPDFSGYSKIAELATIKCVYHNVAEIYNDGTNMLFGINVGYKKAWFEYDGTMQLGVDVSKVRIEGPDENNVVTIVIPQAQVLGVPDADESTFSDVYSDTGLLTSITSVDQAEAYAAAQDKMRESAEGNEMLIREARDRAEMLLFQYVEGVGKKLGVEYEIRVKDAGGAPPPPAAVSFSFCVLVAAPSHCRCSEGDSLFMEDSRHVCCGRFRFVGQQAIVGKHRRV